MNKLFLYTVFHLNMAYSSIKEDDRPEVIKRCYWPLLRLAREFRLPLGIEASGYTLEKILEIDPDWIRELKSLTQNGPCEFIGSGYAQIIGPLVPSKVNAMNLKLGHEVYKKLLGLQPKIALVNEQAYSAGLVEHYLKAGYKAIITEWDNPVRHHPEWKSEWRYLPQIAKGVNGEIPLIWNKSIAFQKFQRYAQGEMKLEEYLEYLQQHAAKTPRAFPLYGNDAEVFNFRPGRFRTEPDIQEDEWQRMAKLFSVLSSDPHYQWIRPGQVLNLMKVKGAGHRLHLESPEQPAPVKKQEKYNITRWAVTGLDDLAINTFCWRRYEMLQANLKTSRADWKELCFLWDSDFRTHITLKRWKTYLKRLMRWRGRLKPGSRQLWNSFSKPLAAFNSSLPSNIHVLCEGRYLLIETKDLKIVLNCRRGLAIDKLWFKKVSNEWLCGTLPQGYYDNIRWGADYYTGHAVFQTPGQSKVTDLSNVDPVLGYDGKGKRLIIKAEIKTPLGRLLKQIEVFPEKSSIRLGYQFYWPRLPIGSLRLGYLTLNPRAFDSKKLFFRTHQGGKTPETFFLHGREIDHASPVSFLVSAQGGIGMTEGWAELGDGTCNLRAEASRTEAALLGMIQHHRIGRSYFYRLVFSAREMDETSRADSSLTNLANPISYRISITAFNSP